MVGSECMYKMNNGKKSCHMLYTVFFLCVTKNVHFLEDNKENGHLRLCKRNTDSLTNHGKVLTNLTMFDCNRKNDGYMPYASNKVCFEKKIIMR